jgi:hypothetical protein
MMAHPSDQAARTGIWDQGPIAGREPVVIMTGAKGMAQKAGGPEKDFNQDNFLRMPGTIGLEVFLPPARLVPGC